MTDEELESLIGAMHTKLNEIYQLDPQWKKRGEWKQGDRGSLVYPPAAEKDIRSCAQVYLL